MPQAAHAATLMWVPSSAPTTASVRSGLQGQQDALLKDLAWFLTEHQSVAIAEAELLTLLNASLARLRINGALFTQFTAPETVELLLEDSILAATGDPGARIVTFAHQLLQEWFAAYGAWTLVPPSLSRRARVVSVEMTMGRFVLRSAPPGRQEPSAAVVIPAVRPTWHNVAKPAQRLTR